MNDFYTRSAKPRGVPLRVAGSPDLDETMPRVICAHQPVVSPRVLAEAVDAARRSGSSLRVVLFGADTTAAPANVTLRAAREMAESSNETAVAYELQRADTDVASQVLDLADRHEAPLIVLGVRRRSAVMKLILGSYAPRVILEAQRPVLSVR